MADPDRAAKILKQIPLGRLGSPEEAASIITYLANPLSQFITGQVIPLSGGWATAR
jgi:NAD(P)-dependent dehydrogenase (short-subunit alcohol dehydrogenase family)